MNALRDAASRSSGSYDPVLVDDGDPTQETYADLNRAFRFFNERLFDGRLQPSLITLRARGRTNGYFSSERFVHADGRRSHEIALNPEMFACFTIERSLSTLVHEQVHQIQFQDGTASRRGYHNTDWADRMEAIGLMPSTTGRPGGARTGEMVTHYLIPGGRFLVAVRELLDDSFRARWADRFVTVPRQEWLAAEGEGEDPTAATASSTGADPDPEAPTAVVPHGVSMAVWPRQEEGREATGREFGEDESCPAAATEPMLAATGCQPGGEPPVAATNPMAFVFGRTARVDNSKTKFVCGGCRAAAWGKRSLKLVCGDCQRPMPSVNATAVQPPGEDEASDDADHQPSPT